MKHISSRDNAVWKSLVRLCHSGRERRKQSRCVIEGAHSIRAYVERFGAPELVVADRDRINDAEISALLDTVGGADVIVVDPRLFTDLAQTATPTGVLAVAPTPKPASTTPGYFSLVLEDVQDPGNVGSMMRIAAAAGASHVFLTSGCAFAWSPKVLRAGQGAHFYLDIIENADIAQLTTSFAGTIVGALPRASVSVFDADLRGALILLIGNEGAGLSEAALAAAKLQVAIPMPGGFESLNAAVATAVCVFEKLRQDRGAAPGNR
ncbi:MAG: RNA methyltransferase [Betaproteobacteria bacterium]